jgi:hypothetical protein
LLLYSSLLFYSACPASSSSSSPLFYTRLFILLFFLLQLLLLLLKLLLLTENQFSTNTAVAFWLAFERFRVRIPTGTQTILRDIFRGFLSLWRQMPEQSQQSGHGFFLPHPFRFTIDIHSDLPTASVYKDAYVIRMASLQAEIRTWGPLNSKQEW